MPHRPCPARSVRKVSNSVKRCRPASRASRSPASAGAIGATATPARRTKSEPSMSQVARLAGVEIRERAQRDAGREHGTGRRRGPRLATHEPLRIVGGIGVGERHRVPRNGKPFQHTVLVDQRPQPRPRQRRHVVPDRRLRVDPGEQRRLPRATLRQPRHAEHRIERRERHRHAVVLAPRAGETRRQRTAERVAQRRRRPANDGFRSSSPPRPTPSAKSSSKRSRTAN